MSRPTPPVQTKSCEVCGATITRPTGRHRISATEWSAVRSCRGRCSAIVGWKLRTPSASRRTPRTRLLESDVFDEYAPKSGNGCWEWSGSRNDQGYGICGSGRRYAHRVAWERAHGPIPDDMCVLHRCDNPPCVRPDHLFLGTRADNMHDMWSKARGKAPTPLVGEQHPMARLSDHDVRVIKDRLATGESQTSVARSFGVHLSTVHLIAKGKTWTHVWSV